LTIAVFEAANSRQESQIVEAATTLHACHENRRPFFMASKDAGT